MTDTVAPVAFRSLKWSVDDGKIGAWVAESDFGTSPAIAEALHRAVDEGFLTYLPPATARAAEAACASFQRDRFGWEVDAADVHLIPDVLDGLRLTLTHFARPGAVIVPTPAYMPFLTLPAALGREIVQVPSIRTKEGWQLDLEAVDAAFAAGASVFVLCNPHNPLGQVMTADDHAALADVVARHDGLVFSDEIHAPIVYGGAVHVPYASSSPVAAAHTITATATSKGWNVPGLKAAQVILSSDAHRALWEEKVAALPAASSILGAVAARSAYEDPSPWLADTVERLRGNRDALAGLLTEHLPGVTWTVPDATYLAWLDFTGTAIAAAPSAFLAEHAGVVTTDGAACGTGYEGWVRFNFALDPGQLDAAVRRMGAALATAAERGAA